eukprot:SAG11_NODE_33214_length_278_cov_1.162011_1_plen_36_part_10
MRHAALQRAANCTCRLSLPRPKAEAVADPDRDERCT